MLSESIIQRCPNYLQLEEMSLSNYLLISVQFLFCCEYFQMSNELNLKFTFNLDSNKTNNLE